MTKEKKQINTITEPMLRENYEALEYLTWFAADTQNVQNRAGTIFRGGIDFRDPRFLDLLAAANKAIQETEDDIAKLKEFLAKIVPTT